MARDPGSVWVPLPEAGAPDGYTKTQFIVHSTGDNGTAANTRRYFSGPTLNESTFIVGWGPEDPTLQIMDSTDNADANGSANQRGISVEVVGDGIGGYNAWQRSEIIRLARWSMANHPGILPRVIPSEPAAGLGWHVMFGAPGPWAKVAKSCPGKQRIHELKTDIFPAIFAGSEGSSIVLDDATQLQISKIVVNALTTPLIQWDAKSGNAPTSLLQQVQLNAQGLSLIYGELQATREVIAQLSSGGGTSAAIDLKAIEEAGRRGAQSALDELTVTVSTSDDTPA